MEISTVKTNALIALIKKIDAGIITDSYNKACFIHEGAWDYEALFKAPFIQLVALFCELYDANTLYLNSFDIDNFYQENFTQGKRNDFYEEKYIKEEITTFFQNVRILLV